MKGAIGLTLDQEQAVPKQDDDWIRCETRKSGTPSRIQVFPHLTRASQQFPAVSPSRPADTDEWGGRKAVAPGDAPAWNRLEIECGERAEQPMGYHHLPFGARAFVLSSCWCSRL